MRGPNDKSTIRAGKLRRNQTSAEAKLWAALRGRQVDGMKFVRQELIGRYIADFACRSVKLVMELDGVTHESSEEVAHDERR
jgi:very-short-patch-repair endonuclease